MHDTCRWCGVWREGGTAASVCPSIEERAYIDQGNARAKPGRPHQRHRGLYPGPDPESAEYHGLQQWGMHHADRGDLRRRHRGLCQALTFDPQYANAYYNRAGVRATEGDKAGAVADFRQAADLYEQQGKTADYQDTLKRIKELQVKYADAGISSVRRACWRLVCACRERICMCIFSRHAHALCA